VSRLAIIGLCLVLMLAAISQTMLSQEDREPTPDTSSYPTLFFPGIGLDCPVFETPIVGAKWNNITIGQTTFEDFERILLELGDYFIRPDGFYGGTSIAYMLPYEVETAWWDEQIPSLVTVCVQNNIITVLMLDISYNELPLANYIAQYDQPDVITWDSDSMHRNAFWFERGLAVQVFIGPPDNGAWGWTGLITYFPYQKVDGYQTRWPYNATWQRPWYNVRNCCDLTEEAMNPFDIPATMTAIKINPTWTPTPTFTPRPNLTAAPSPTP
jgi:hypothetical protein